ncbi:hypothetical protein AAMO2058_000013500 [Amorphochlora amoebiformis]
MIRYNTVYYTCRRIRSWKPNRSEDARNWAKPGNRFALGVLKRSLEYSKAVARFTILLGSQSSLEIKKIEYYRSAKVEYAFQKSKSDFHNPNYEPSEVWVFHGTPERNVRHSMSHGFKVGGAEVPIANDVHGSGVYTATGPSVPLEYGGRREDWIVFKSWAQLLPVYVLHIRTRYTPTPKQNLQWGSVQNSRNIVRSSVQNTVQRCAQNSPRIRRSASPGIQCCVR